ncbi:MAG: alpha-ketoglutarate-dependent dioxygenase AlkB [Pseudomonadota bacterium]
MNGISPRDIRGIRLFDGFLDGPAQAAMAEDVRAIARAAPFVRPVTRRGPMSVRMTSAGAFGWVSDRVGYRYDARRISGGRWPPIPARVLDVWRAVVPEARAPECCLVNWYGPDARMGMHQDRDEADFDQPVVSISLGDDALFRVGNRDRGGRTESVWLRSGDVLVMAGAARLLHHGVDRIAPGTSTLLEAPGRINLTLRVVTAADGAPNF